MRVFQWADRRMSMRVLFLLPGEIPHNPPLSSITRTYPIDLPGVYIEPYAWTWR